MPSAQLVHDLLENTRCKIRLLVSLKMSWKANDGKNLINTFTIVGALIFRTGIAYGNLILAHITVSRYWLPDQVLGSGPTQSTNTLLNGSSIVGMGFKGTGLGIWFDFPNTWQA